MPHEIGVVEEGNIIHLKYFSKVTLEDLIMARDPVLNIISTKKIQKIIIYMQEAILSTTLTEEFLVVSRLKEILPYSIKIAVIINNRNPYYSRHRFAETVSRNRGINWRIFNEYNDGIQWLLK